MLLHYLFNLHNVIDTPLKTAFRLTTMSFNLILVIFAFSCFFITTSFCLFMLFPLQIIIEFKLKLISLLLSLFI